MALEAAEGIKGLAGAVIQTGRGIIQLSEGVPKCDVFFRSFSGVVSPS
jgi:hypothetical protein